MLSWLPLDSCRYENNLSFLMIIVTVFYLISFHSFVLQLLTNLFLFIHSPIYLFKSICICQTGVSRHLFERWCDDERNGVVLAGYTVEGTLAHDLLNHPTGKYFIGMCCVVFIHSCNHFGDFSKCWEKGNATQLAPLFSSVPPLNSSLLSPLCSLILLFINLHFS